MKGVAWDSVQIGWCGVMKWVKRNSFGHREEE